MFIRVLILMFFISVILCSCDKEDENSSDTGTLQYGVTVIDNVSFRTIIVTTPLIKAGSNEIIQHGHCWGTNPGPTLGNDKTSLGKLAYPASFTSELTDLTENTTYYIRAYFTTNNEVLYADEINVTTLKTGIPLVNTSDISNLAYNAVTLGGVVVSDSGCAVTVRGVCWNITGNPDLNNHEGLTQDSCGTGLFESHISGLQELTTYYLRAYASNNNGQGYGEVISCTTPALELPVVETSGISYISYTEARCSGKVITDGNANVTSRGVCWNTSGNPTLENHEGFTVNGQGTGEFSALLSGLTENTSYYINAYASNVKGTAYGNPVSFNTLDDPCNGDTIITYLNQTYDIVIIGTQCWMADNLNVGQRIDGAQEMEDNDVMEKYCYNNNEDNCDEYGALYQWNEMMQYTTLEGAQGICPAGWHIPTDEEWKILEGNVDSHFGVGSAEWDKLGGRGYNAGYNIKSTTHWVSSGGGSDLYGFTALPAGYRGSGGSFKDIETYTCFMSSTELDSDNYWRRYLYYTCQTVFRNEISKDSGRSVRCLKDN